MMRLKKQQVDAAQEFASATASLLKTERGITAETAIAGVARMAGTFLFRSFGLPVKKAQPGQFVLSMEANEQGLQLMRVLEGALAVMGINLEGDRLNRAQGIGSKPQMSFLETQKRLEPTFVDIQTRYELSAQEAAASGAFAAAILIKHCSQVLDSHVAFGIAVDGFIVGTKTVPDPVTL